MSGPEFEARTAGLFQTHLAAINTASDQILVGCFPEEAQEFERQEDYWRVVTDTADLDHAILEPDEYAAVADKFNEATEGYRSLKEKLHVLELTCLGAYITTDGDNLQLLADKDQLILETPRHWAASDDPTKTIVTFRRYLVDGGQIVQNNLQYNIGGDETENNTQHQINILNGIIDGTSSLPIEPEQVATIIQRLAEYRILLHVVREIEDPEEVINFVARSIEANKTVPEL